MALQHTSMTSTTSFIYLLCILTLLSACIQQSYQHPPTLSKILPIVQPDLNIPDTWKITAKLGIRSKTNSGSVTLYWQQQQNRYHIRVIAPLGQGKGVLFGDNTFVTIERANKKTMYSDNPTELIEKSFGWLLPLEHLNYWVRGLPNPLLDVAETSYNTTGTIASLQQSGWSLTYTDYQIIDTWLSMPKRIRAQKNDVILTLVIKQWEFPTPAHTINE